MAQDEAPRPRRGRRSTWALLAVVTLVNLLALPRYEYVGDPFARPAGFESMLQGIDGVLRSNYLWFDGRSPSVEKTSPASR